MITPREKIQYLRKKFKARFSKFKVTVPPNFFTYISCGPLMWEHFESEAFPHGAPAKIAEKLPTANEKFLKGVIKFVKSYCHFTTALKKIVELEFMLALKGRSGVPEPLWRWAEKVGDGYMDELLLHSYMSPDEHNIKKYKATVARKLKRFKVKNGFVVDMETLNRIIRKIYDGSNVPGLGPDERRADLLRKDMYVNIAGFVDDIFQIRYGSKLKLTEQNIRDICRGRIG